MVFLRPPAGRVRTAALVCALVLSWASFAAAQPTLENDVKAVFLYNFTKFIEWPPSATPASAGPFRLCLLADADFSDAVDRAIAGETVGSRQLERVEPQSPDDVHNCAILYVGRRHTERGLRFLAAARNLPVLTVGDGASFLEQGGAIRFVLDNNRVRFDISTVAMQRSGLRVSSKLLRVARSVEGETR
jgi:hypothetical protein